MNEKERIRIGNDVNVAWAIVRRQYDPDGNVSSVPYPLDGKDLRLTMKVGTVEIPVYEFSVTGKDRNVVSFTFYGRDQKNTGGYTLILTENAGRPGMLTLDRCEAFHLVSRSCEEREGCTPRVHVHSVKLVSLVDAMQGVAGKSAYQEWLDAGNDGSQADFLASLHGKDGADGKSAYEVAVDNGFEGTEAEWLESIGGLAPDERELLDAVKDALDGGEIVTTGDAVILDCGTSTT